jgi:hypothetical protein
MLRRLIPAIAVLFAAACSSSATAPASTTISVRVLDDVGQPVFRNQVNVIFDGQEPVRVLTNHSGIARVEVAEAGEYLVTVVPKIGYDGSTGSIVKRVTVASNATSTVEFTIYRSGLGI